MCRSNTIPRTLWHCGNRNVCQWQRQKRCWQRLHVAVKLVPLGRARPIGNWHDDSDAELLHQLFQILKCWASRYNRSTATVPSGPCKPMCTATTWDMLLSGTWGHESTSPDSFSDWTVDENAELLIEQCHLLAILQMFLLRKNVIGYVASPWRTPFVQHLAARGRKIVWVLANLHSNCIK